MDWEKFKKEHEEFMNDLDNKFKVMETGLLQIGILKRQDEPVTEEILAKTVNRFVHVPVNMHTTLNDLTGEQEEVNAWFAGAAAGYQITKVWFDHDASKFLDAPVISYTLLLADGTGFSIADRSEIYPLTEREFKDLIEKQKKKDSILMPGKDFQV